MPENLQSFLGSCLLTMLRPLTDFCVSRGLRYQDVAELLKKSFLISAEKHLRGAGKNHSVSRLSVMSGIQRPEVVRLLKKGPEEKATKDFITRVVGQWASDKRFLEGSKPKKLTYEGPGSGFAKLVTAVSTDLSPHTVRFELERLGLVETAKGHVKLLSQVFSTGGDPKTTLSLGALDVNDLLTCLEENAFAAHDIPNLQARTEYDNVPDEALPTIRNWFLEAGSLLHEKARNFLSTFDRDISNAGKKSEGRNRIVLGTYSRIHAVELEPDRK